MARSAKGTRIPRITSERREEGLNAEIGEAHAGPEEE